MRPKSFASVEEYALSIIELQADPPRSVRLMDVLAVVLHLKDNRRLVFFGVIGILLALLEWVPFEDILRSAFFFLGGLFLICVPFVQTVQCFRLLRFGISLKANVTSVTYTPPGPSRNRDDQTNGVATGTMELNPNGLPTQLDFRINDPWANSIHQGSCIHVLMNPNSKLFRPLTLGLCD